MCFTTEGTKSNTKAQNVLKMDLNFTQALNKIILVSSFMHLIYSCKRNYVSNTTFILWNSSYFGLNISWRQLFLQIYWLVFSLKCSYKKNSFKNILDDRILPLERIAYKGQPTKKNAYPYK